MNITEMYVWNSMVTGHCVQLSQRVQMFLCAQGWIGL